MSNFSDFKVAVSKQFEEMSYLNLFTTNIDKDKLWDEYLNSFPAGTDKIFRERTEHDCQCCKQFIRNCGNVVAIIDNELVSIWDIQLEEDSCYQVVANALSELVVSAAIDNIFLHFTKNLGVDYNHQLLEDGSVLKWEHFHFLLKDKFVNHNDIGYELSKSRSNKEVFKRSLEEVSIYAIKIVLDLIDQGSIYRGEEHKSVVKLFLNKKETYDSIDYDNSKDYYCWDQSYTLGPVSKFRNTAIGTLLTDISNDIELDTAVKSFELKVAPENYKRPTALITKRMVDNAQDLVVDLGIEKSLYRRYANVSDITVNNILFIDRNTKKEMNIFDEIAKDIPINIKTMDKTEEIDIDTFINDIVPNVDSIQMLVENNHINNFVSLIAPQDKESKNIFKWDNNFSWSYNGEVTDSIKEKVKKAGGNVDADLRCSLSWFNRDDLDIHVVEPDGSHVFFGRKQSGNNCFLDVDMNVHSNRAIRDAVENIVWTNKSRMLEGVYNLYVNNYTCRERVDVGFDIEMEFEGIIYTFHQDKPVRQKILAVRFEFLKAKGIRIISSIPSTHTSKDIWGISTYNFHPVSMIMNSPNHWDGKTTGNKHYFFILNNCINESTSRGFYNEFLNENLREHRKVFEVLGSKMKVEESNNQLSGLGFSSTRKNQIICKVTGNFSRTLKINF